MIEYEEETYHDDRMFVINLSRGIVETAGKNETKWLLTTYRNVISLPPFRGDHFESKAEAIEYLQRVEPNVPLISNQEAPLSIPEDVDRWEYWIDWLKERGLKSAITGYQHLPDLEMEEGHDPRDYYVKIVELTEEDLL